MKKREVVGIVLIVISIVLLFFATVVNFIFENLSHENNKEISTGNSVASLSFEFKEESKNHGTG